ncbi:MAG TPA: M28 family peptidase, partial [Longimicrobiales bacterium]|nr:M28 family peptidase [Longimicrobiales bacterium]
MNVEFDRLGMRGGGSKRRDSRGSGTMHATSPRAKYCDTLSQNSTVFPVRRYVPTRYLSRRSHCNARGAHHYCCERCSTRDAVRRAVVRVSPNAASVWLRGVGLSGLAVLAVSLPVSGQATLPSALADPAVQAGLLAIENGAGEAAQLLVEIGAIESPSGQEHARAEAVAERMRAIGLTNVSVDGTPNVVGRIAGRSGRALVFVSTLDDLPMVAEHQRQATSPPQIQGSRVAGPGTNTSATTVAMLTAAQALIDAGVRPEHDLVFAAVAQEETGLVGMKQLYSDWADRAVAFVDVLGDGR